MRGLLSLDQELRAARRAKGQKNASQSNRTPDTKETGRPWQEDIDQIHQTMREVLRAIAGLSGVELPGLPPGVDDDGAPAPRLDIKTLKDRFRNDLEGYSIKTTEELTKRAKEQTNAALDAVQNQLGERIEQVAAEFQKQLQLPAQVEKLLEPSVAEATATLEKSLSQKVEELFDEQKRIVQDRLKDVLTTTQANVNTAEEATARLERSLSQKVEQLFAERERLVEERLQGSLSSIQSQVSTVEEAATRLERSFSQKVDHLTAEQERLAQERLRRAPVADQPQIGTVEDAEARLQNSLSQKVQQLFAERERLVQERIQSALRSVQDQISALEQAVWQIRELQADSVAQLSAGRSNTATDSAMGKNENRRKDELDGNLDQAFSRIKSSLSNFLGSSKTQPAHDGVERREEQPTATRFNDMDSESRVQQALEHLGRLGSKNPQPADKIEGLKATS